MQAAFHSLLTLAIVWGLPVYLLDRRARYNDRPGWMRFAIAFFMLFYFLIVPIFMAFALAGPKRPRRSRRPTGFLADHPPFVERYDPRPHAAYVQDDSRARQANAQRRKEQEDRDRQELQELLSQGPQHEPSRHSQTRPYLTPDQRLEQHELNQARRRREQEQQQAQKRREAEQRTAQREAQVLQARRDRHEQAAREKQERQDRADRERQAQDDLFMTWDERGEEELAE
jgi:hypothetical protein